MSDSNFEKWWRDEGSAIRPSMNEDAEEFVRRVCQIAWSNGKFMATWKRFGDKHKEIVI